MKRHIERFGFCWSLGLIITAGFSTPGFAANQTDTVTTIQLNSQLPYRVELQPYDFGAAPLPTLHSYAAGQFDGKWVLIAGRTNGLHGFTQVAASNFPPQFQNKDVWVIDPVTKQSWSRSLEDMSAGLTQEELNSLTQANNQFYQRGNRLYMTGGYGFQLNAGGTPLNGTFDKLTAIDLGGIVDWVTNGTGTAKSHIRQTSDPLFRVTGGAMYEIDGRSHLVFGQNFQGNYTPNTNGIYTNQVRSFNIVDDGATLAIANPTSTTPDPNYRRRDLNVFPVLRTDPGDQLENGLVVLSGVFTPTNGAWTVPVEVDALGNPTMDDPNDPAAFKQGFNGYHSAKLGLFSEATGAMHELLFGGISLQSLDQLGQVATDANLPFVNDVTSVVIDAAGNYSQHWMGRFPELTDESGKQLRFGANSEFLLSDGIETFDNGVLKLDNITAPTAVGYIFGGIAANGPHTRGVPGVTSAASNTIFRVVLVPVPEPTTTYLWAFGFVGLAFGRRRGLTGRLGGSSDASSASSNLRCRQVVQLIHISHPERRFMSAPWLHVFRAFSCLLMLSVCHIVCADTIYDEDVNGDLSGDYNSPTQFVLTPGVNTLYAYTGSSDSEDLEYLRIDLPVGHQLNSLLMQYFAGPDQVAFIGLQSGTEFTFPASEAFANIDNMLGWSHFGPDAGHNVGDDLLPSIGANGQTFVSPLTGPSYTFWIQQTGSNMYYQLDFIVEAVPEPASCWMAGSAGLLALMLRRRVKSSFCLSSQRQCHHES